MAPAFVTVGLRLQGASEPPTRVVKNRGLDPHPEFLIHQAWGGTPEIAFLPGSQVRSMLLAQGPHFGMLTDLKGVLLQE